jgi:hypothetical protein
MPALRRSQPQPAARRTHVAHAMKHEGNNSNSQSLMQMQCSLHILSATLQQKCLRSLPEPAACRMPAAHAMKLEGGNSNSNKFNAYAMLITIMQQTCHRLPQTAARCMPAAHAMSHEGNNSSNNNNNNNKNKNKNKNNAYAMHITLLQQTLHRLCCRNICACAANHNLPPAACPRRMP